MPIRYFGLVTRNNGLRFPNIYIQIIAADENKTGSFTPVATTHP